MFILDQRAPIPNTNSLISRQSLIMKDDKIRINKPNIYYKDRIDLKN